MAVSGEPLAASDLGRLRRELVQDPNGVASIQHVCAQSPFHRQKALEDLSCSRGIGEAHGPLSECSLVAEVAALKKRQVPMSGVGFNLSEALQDGALVSLEHLQEHAGIVDEHARETRRLIAKAAAHQKRLEGAGIEWRRFDGGVDDLIHSVLEMVLDRIRQKRINARSKP